MRDKARESRQIPQREGPRLLRTAGQPAPLCGLPTSAHQKGPLWVAGRSVRRVRGVPLYSSVLNQCPNAGRARRPQLNSLALGLELEEVLKSVDNVVELPHLSRRECDAGHETLPRHRIVAEGEDLRLTAKDHLFVGNETR